MSKEEITTLREELIVRNMIPNLTRACRSWRMSVSTSSVHRALAVEDFKNATLLKQRILKEAQKMLTASANQ